MNNNTFFSSKNKDLLYNICRDEIYRDNNYSIDDNKKYYKTFGEIMKIVYKHAENKNDLSELNKSVLGKTIPYLKGAIEKKGLNNGPLMPPGNPHNPNNKPMNIKGYDAQGTNIPNANRDTSVGENYRDKMTERPEFYVKSDNVENNQKVDNIVSEEDPKMLMERMMKERENMNLKKEKSSDYKLESMDLEPNLNSLDNNMNTYNSSNDNTDPMQLYNQYNNQRELQDTEYTKMTQNMENFENSNQNNNQFIDNLLEKEGNKKTQEEKEFQENMSMKINDQMSRSNLGELKGQLDDFLDFATENKKGINLPTANDLALAQNNNIHENNSLFEEFKKSMLQKRKYINREHFITINSGDRDWFNNSKESRFNFRVKFKNSTHSTIPRTFKNIVSFEMIRSLFAIENIILPFDNRIYIDFKSLPYMVLKIDEIDGLYSGTNKRLEGAFAHLLWDKDNTSEVLTSDYGTNAKYSRVVKRGFCLMAPLGFEKKTYYPSPLASLQSLTIDLMTPQGKNINNHPDVFSIQKIELIASSNQEIDASNNFPHQDFAFVIRITTHSFFSNRIFKIGDNIKIKGFVDESSDTFDINNFINRDEGHYIINLDKEEKGSSTNEGFIKELYISPPGEIDFTDESSTSGILKSGTITSHSSGETYFEDTAGSSDSTENCKLINQSLQSNYVFKIITREDDASEVMNSRNV